MPFGNKQKINLATKNYKAIVNFVRGEKNTFIFLIN